jgi:hypothetical protein
MCVFSITHTLLCFLYKYIQENLLMEQQLSYFTGRDGFVWWIGVVEDRGDPMSLGRVRCRIFGYHTEDKTKLPTVDLPWALCMQPANSASSGGVGSSPTGPIEGTWCVGFWRDPDYMQEPMVLGTIPGNNTSASAPQGGAPFDFSPETTKETDRVETVTIIADGTTTEFATPFETTDATVLVTKDGQSDRPTNKPPESYSNTEVDAPDYSWGRTWTAEDFDGVGSRKGAQTAKMLNQLLPWVRNRFAQGIINIISQNEGYDATIGAEGGFRTPAMQRAIKSRGVKAASKSYHEFAVAIDLVIYVNGKYDTGSRSPNPYTGVARSSMASAGLKNDISNDPGHFYPQEFSKGVPSKVKNNQQSISDYAKSVGIQTEDTSDTSSSSRVV